MRTEKEIYDSIEKLKKEFKDQDADEEDAVIECERIVGQYQILYWILGIDFYPPIQYKGTMADYLEFMKDFIPNKLGDKK